MNLKLLVAAAVFGISANAQIVLFTGFNSDGTDNIAFFTTTSVAESTVIRFTDNEWNGSAIGSGGAFNSGEARWSWTAPSGGLAAGTIVLIDNIGSGTIAANVGTVAFEDSANRGIANSGESIYAYLGTDNNPSSFIGYISNGTDTFANTGLSSGSSAFTLTSGTDIGAYTGSRNNQSSLTDYQSQVYTIANWALQDASNDQSADLTSPDVPFSSTGFTAVPEPQEYAFFTGVTLIGVAVWRRRANGNA